MTGLQAALGLVQLDRLSDWHLARRRNAGVLLNALSGSPPFRVPLPAAGVTHAFYRLYAFVRPEALAGDWSRDPILDEIHAAGFPALTGTCPEIYRERAFADRGLGPDEPLPVAHDLGETSLAFLVDPAQSEDHLHRLADFLRRLQERAARRSLRPAKAAA